MLRVIPHFAGRRKLRRGKYHLTPKHNAVNLHVIDCIATFAEGCNRCRCIPTPERKITSEPRHGEMISVEIPTTIHAVLEFANGALVTLGASWDVKAHGHRPMELYGTEASLIVPIPISLAANVQGIEQGGKARDLPAWSHPLGVPNQQHSQGMMANYRTAGLADMAIAIMENRAHRCSLEFRPACG
jgi:predicted dehydrogenase